MMCHLLFVHQPPRYGCQTLQLQLKNKNGGKHMISPTGTETETAAAVNDVFTCGSRHG